jgi:type II secretory pathway component PulL
MSAHPLTLQHRTALSNTFILSFFPQNERYSDMGIIFKQQTAVSEEARANSVFWEEL